MQSHKNFSISLLLSLYLVLFIFLGCLWKLCQRALVQLRLLYDEFFKLFVYLFLLWRHNNKHKMFSSNLYSIESMIMLSWQFISFVYIEFASNNLWKTQRNAIHFFIINAFNCQLISRGMVARARIKSKIYSQALFSSLNLQTSSSFLFWPLINFMLCICVYFSSSLSLSPSI